MALDREGHTPWLIVVIIAALGILLGLVLAPHLRRAFVYETPAPRVPVDPRGAPETRGPFLEYVQSLRFDSVTHGVSDYQVLMYHVPPPVDQLVPGPAARILPEVGSHRGSPSAIQEGRVVARIESDSAYAPLGLPPGVSYLWIDGLERLSPEKCRTRVADIVETYAREYLEELRAAARTSRDIGVVRELGRAAEALLADTAPPAPDAGGTRATSDTYVVLQQFVDSAKAERTEELTPCDGVANAVFVPADTTTPAHEGRRVVYYAQPDGERSHALARWIFRKLDDDTWTTCPAGCCRPMGGMQGAGPPPVLASPPRGRR